MIEIEDQKNEAEKRNTNNPKYHSINNLKKEYPELCSNWIQKNNKNKNLQFMANLLKKKKKFRTLPF